MTKASDSVDFSSKEYSAEDGELTEATDWKRTYRMLLKGSPALQEIYCDLSSVPMMARSAAVEEAFPPVPFEEARSNVTEKAYVTFHQPSTRGAGPVGSFLAWLRGVRISDAGAARPRGQEASRELRPMLGRFALS